MTPRDARVVDAWLGCDPPSQLVLVGAAGSGRSRTLADLADRARARGWTVSSMRPSADDAREPASAARVLGADAGDGALDGDQLVGALGRAWAAPSSEPHLLCLDDVDQLAPAIIRAVCAAARRTAVRIALTATNERHLVAGLPEAKFHELTPLPPDQLRDVVRGAAGRGPIPEVLDRLTLLADGNPGVAEALTMSLSEAQLLGFEPLSPAAFVVPLRTRLTSRIPAELRPAALLLACGPATPPAVLERAGAELGVTGEHLDALERARLAEGRRGGLVLRPSGLGFALEATMTTTERRGVHAALARACADHDEVRTLWHRALAAGEADAGLADQLEALCEQTPRLGGWSMVSLLAERASELSADAGERGRRLALAAEHAWLEGTPARSLRLLTEAEDLSSDLDLKLRVAYVRGSIELAAGAGNRALRVLAEAVPDALQRLPLHESTALMVRACDAAEAAGDIVAVVRLGRRAEARLIDGMDSVASVRLRLIAGTAKVLADDMESGIAVMEEVLSACARERDQSHSLVGMRASLIVGDMHGLMRFTDQAMDRLREIGDRGMMPFVTARRALAETLLGRLRSALELSSAGVEESGLLGQENARAEHLAVQALAHARAGDGQEAGRAAELALHLASDFGLAWPGAIAVWALGEVELGSGNPERALELFTLLWHGTTYERHPLIATLAAPELVEAAERSDRRRDSDVAMRRLVSWARATGSAAAAGLVERCTALRAGSSAETVASYERALSLHREALRPFDEARTALAFGSWLRRERRKSECRAYLRLAHERFESFGAAGWQASAAQEMRASGDSVLRRDRVTDGARLTAQEHAVSVMVADGESNRQVAEKLSLSVRTVEYHLRNVYLKLGVRNRTELAANRHLFVEEYSV
ncbi:helix-turn-helix transcriptional regulator [Mycolicibacterium goodii]|uniref:helix-turn-helix transcriptional regulator n=1 Tax=Mycolicibacterium goodii TaxID=134601 RepID=UPI000A9E6D1B